MGKQAIIDKIIGDAEARADAMISEAKAKADAAVADAERAAEELRAANAKDIERTVSDILFRSETVAELDAKKLLLRAKADVIDSVYASALEKAKNLPKDSYKQLILGMLSQAEDGDVVTISDREKNIVTKKALADIAKSRGIKLTLAEERGCFDGGVVLTGGGVDKNFTLDVEIALLRDATEAETAKRLYQ